LIGTHPGPQWPGCRRFEPFKTYAPFFRVYRVDVVSIDSGADINDLLFFLMRFAAGC
jgi:hypothetical protein